MGGAALKDLRRRIDRVDEALLALLEERMALCRDIAAVKAAEGLPLEDSAREAEVLARAGVFREVFREIIRLCKEVQRGA